MIMRWVARSVLGALALWGLLGCAADGTSPLSLDSGAAGISIKTTPDTTKGVAGVQFPVAGVPGVVFSVSGGAAGALYYWTVAGTLAPGLALFPPEGTPSNTLTLFGVPSEGGVYPLQISVHTAPNHALLVSGQIFPIEIAGDSNTPPVIQSLGLTWFTGVTYQQALTATGGKTPYASWYAAGLPPEITLDSKTGTLSGTPVNIGDYNVTLSVLDAAGREGKATLVLSVKTWTLADAQGTWTGVIKTGPLANKRLSLLFNDVGVAQQGTMNTTILATTALPLTFTIPKEGTYAGQLEGDVGKISWHLVCRPVSNSDLDCIGHSFSGLSFDGSVTLSKVNGTSQDLTAPTVASSVFASGATDGGGPRVTVTFSELMSGTGTAGISITLSGTGTVGTPTFVSNDPTTLDARTLTIPLSQVANGTNYVLTLNPTGQTGFLDLAGNALGTKAITFTTGTVGTNQPPVATSLTLSTPMNTTKKITLTGSDPKGRPLKSAQVVSGSGPAKGALTVITWTGAGPYVTAYTPSVIGFDSFQFTVTDADNTESLPATVTITTGAANRQPTAIAQTLSVAHGKPLTITLTGDDPDLPLGDALKMYTIVANSGPQNGTLSGTGSVKTYTLPDTTPPRTYPVVDSFQFTVTDSAGWASAPATVTITVTNQAPTASTQSITVVKNAPTVITLMATDLDGDTLTYTVPANTTSEGTLSAGTDATHTYTPPAGYSKSGGADSFSFTVSDGVASPVTATVNITVSPNDPPTAQAQTFTFTRRQQTTILPKAQFAITLTTAPNSPPVAKFKIITWPGHQDSTQSMDAALGAPYQLVNPDTGAITEGGVTASSIVNLTTGAITGAPVIIYTPNICHDIFAFDLFTFVAVDADGLTSAPATVTMNSTTNLCQH